MIQNGKREKYWRWQMSLLMIICIILLYIQYTEDIKAKHAIRRVKHKTCHETNLSIKEKNNIEIAIKNYRDREHANISSFSRYANAMGIGMMRGAMTAILFGNSHILVPSIVIFGSMEGIFTYIKDYHIKASHIDKDDICHD